MGDIMRFLEPCFKAITISCVLYSGAVHAQGLSQSARDWYVTCNDDLYCIAETPGTSNADNKMKLKLERSNKQDGSIFVTVNPGITLKEGMRVDISVLGQDYEAGGKISKIFKGNEMAFAGPARRELIEKLRVGNKGQVTVKFGGDVGTVVYDVSLKGVTTALLLMDQAQQRLDRVDAAIAWGGEPADSLSQAREPEGDEIVGEDGHEDQSEEAYAAANTQAQDAAISDFSSDIGSGSRLYSVNELPDAVAMPGFRVFECDMENTLQGYGAIAQGAGNGNVIFMVPCQSGDVNIEHYIAMTGPKHGNFANTYEFETPPDFNQPNQSTIINPQFEAETGTLTSIQYYSPNSDCGVYSKHAYVADQDFFELLEYREKITCDGKYTPPENYDLVWTIDEMGQ